MPQATWRAAMCPSQSSRKSPWRTLLIWEGGWFLLGKKNASVKNIKEHASKKRFRNQTKTIKNIKLSNCHDSEGKKLFRSNSGCTFLWMHTSEPNREYTHLASLDLPSYGLETAMFGLQYGFPKNRQAPCYQSSSGCCGPSIGGTGRPWCWLQRFQFLATSADRS